SRNWRGPAPRSASMPSTMCASRRTAASRLATGNPRKAPMKPTEMDARMRALEYFHSIRLLPGAWPVLRLDGRSFSRFTEERFEKPFDAKFHELMLKTTQILVEELQASYAYTESDEISLLFPRAWGLFDRELEKTVSVSAGIASAAFSL